MNETEIIAWRIKLKISWYRLGFGMTEHTEFIVFVKVYDSFEKRPINIVNGSPKLINF